MIFLLAALAAFAGLCLIAVPQGLHSNDEGVRYVQMRNFAENGSLEIAWPGFRFGFGANDLSGQGGHFESRDGRLHAITPRSSPGSRACCTRFSMKGPSMSRRSSSCSSPLCSWAQPWIALCREALCIIS
jgi:hypothetical protein